MASARKGQVPVGWNQYCLSETIGGSIKIKNFSRHGKIRKMLAILLYVQFRFTSTHSTIVSCCRPVMDPNRCKDLGEMYSPDDQGGYTSLDGAPRFSLQGLSDALADIEEGMG